MLTTPSQDATPDDRDKHHLLAGDGDAVMGSRSMALFDLKRALGADLRAARWGRGCLWILAIWWSVFLCIILSMFVPVYYWSAIRGFQTTGCQPNDAFNLYPGQYNPFAIGDFFQVTIGFGQLSFTEAKVIDVAWDVVSDAQSTLPIPRWTVADNLPSQLIRSRAGSDRR
jgi:hypothetical protein